MTLNAEQQARAMLDRMGVEGTQNFTAGDLVEMANLIAEREDFHMAYRTKCDEETKAQAIENNELKTQLKVVKEWQQTGEALIESKARSALFSLGEWWADRPWRDRT